MTENEKKTAVAVTGHREIFGDIDDATVKKALNKLVGEGYNIFLVGMALGFDAMCFCALEKIRKKKKIKIIACVPCRDQAKKFSEAQTKEYERMLSSADEVVILSENYTPYCMRKRNEYMVDNASLLLSYKRKETGGTASTVRYAIKKGIPVIEL